MGGGGGVESRGCPARCKPGLIRLRSVLRRHPMGGGGLLVTGVTHLNTADLAVKSGFFHEARLESAAAVVVGIDKGLLDRSLGERGT